MSSGKIICVLTSHDQLGNTGNKTGWYLPEVAHPYKVLTDAGFEVTFVSPKGGKSPMDPGSGEAFKDDEECKNLLKNGEVMKKINNTLKPSDVKPSHVWTEPMLPGFTHYCRELMRFAHGHNTVPPVGIEHITVVMGGGIAHPGSQFKMNQLSCICSDYKALFFAGGHGPMWDLPENQELAKLAAAIYENGGVLGAVCHGTVGFIPIKLSSGEPLLKGQNVTCFTDAEEAAVKLTEAMPFLLETKLKEMGANFTSAGAIFQPHVVESGRVVTGQNPASATPFAQKMVEVIKKS